MGNRPDFNVYVSRQDENGKSFYNNIGAAWNVAKDGISISLQALPVDGKLVLFPWKDKED